VSLGHGRRSPAIFTLSASLFMLAVFFAFSLYSHLRGLGGVLAACGKLMMEGFSWAAFFVPAYFLLEVFILLSRVFRRRGTLILTLSIVPFLTLSLFFLVIGGSPLALPLLLRSSFGVVPPAVFLGLLFALEILFLLTLPGGRSAKNAAVVEKAVKKAEKPKPPPEAVRPRGRLRLIPPAKPSSAGDDEPTELRGPGHPIPIEVEAVVLDPPALPPVKPASGEARPAAKDRAINARPADELPAGVSGRQPELPFEPGSGSKKAYAVPVEGVLKVRSGDAYWEIDDETRRAARVLTDALQEFNIQAEVTGIRKGPVITLFEVLPAPGVRVSKIANLSDNIALRLAAPSVRIVAPIPGKHAVGIEVPNKTRSIVSFREMISLEAVQKSSYEIPIVLGKDILGEAQVFDLIQTPHLLIGGATNSGKSVLVNAIICSILFKKAPEEVRLFLIDPKIVELKAYNGVRHLLTPVITEPRKAFQALQYCISEMERRYTLLDALAVRDIRSYNKKAKREKVSRLPFIVIVVDEFADLMATTGKELESTLARLAAMSRAVGIHMVLATQRPSIDVITGLIKANIPSRIAFMVANKFDSRIIIDSVGAEKLLGKGDMLFSAAWNPFPVRIQGAFVDEEETEAITEYVKKLGPPQYIDDEVFFDEAEEGGDYEGEPGNDPLFDKGLEIIIAQGRASASYLQRRLKIGYNRAARLVEEMEMRGIVGPAQGSKPREILHIPKGPA
jgi:DNA segregation ATPase FtsK/SpoIIIE-like protein